MNENQSPSVCVLDPAPYVEVAIEPGRTDDPELHIHPAGQGFWIARMAARLGSEVTVVSPFGGETGLVLRHLMEHEGLRTVAVASDDSNGGLVHDRRSPDSEPILTPSAQLSRHHRDDLHGAAFSSAIHSDVFVLAGSRTPVVADDVYERLAGDVRRNDTTVLADLSGDLLRAALSGGVDLLKISDVQLRDDGYLSGDDADDVLQAIDRLKDEGAAQVVVSRGDAPSIAAFDGDIFEVKGPEIDPVDAHGGGDSMTGALATALARGASATTALRLAMAAATAGVLRHGLASARAEDIERLADRITLTRL
jgi:1-phosphofructokinase